MSETQQFELEARRETIAHLQRQRTLSWWSNAAIITSLGLMSLMVMLLIVRR